MYFSTAKASRGKRTQTVTESIVRIAGTFTSPHVYPQALLHDQKVLRDCHQRSKIFEKETTLWNQGGCDEYHRSGRVDRRSLSKRKRSCHPWSPLQVTKSKLKFAAKSKSNIADKYQKVIFMILSPPLGCMSLTAKTSWSLYRDGFQISLKKCRIKNYHKLYFSLNIWTYKSLQVPSEWIISLGLYILTSVLPLETLLSEWILSGWRQNRTGPLWSSIWLHYFDNNAPS